MKKLLAVLTDGLRFGVLATGVSYGAFAAQTIIVDPAAEETATTVKTLEAAFAKLANSGDTILVRPGTYYLTQTLTNKVANLVFKSADATTGEIDRENTILDGSQCPGRAFFTQSKATPTINGFTFQNFSPTGEAGGAVMLQSGSGAFKVLNCSFKNNQTDSNGGALYSYLNIGGIISNCCFTGNSVVKTASGNVGGGALYSQQNSNSETDRINVYDCSFTSNSVTCAGQARGGAVYAVRCVYLIRCQFKDNWLSRTTSGEVDGGTISAGHASRLEQCTVTANDTSSGGTLYGLVVALDGTAGHVIDRCVFGPISMTRGGYGLIYYPTGTSEGNVIKSSVFRGLNVSPTIFFINGTHGGKMSNTLLSAVGNGGLGLGKAGATWAYENCTFVTASDGTKVTANGTSSFVNCLSNGSAPTESADCTVTSCLFAGTTAGCGFVKPGVDYRLRPTSQAVDAGVTQPGQDEAKDVGGRPRVVGPCVDIGAYERQPDDPDMHYVRAVATTGEKIGEWADAYVGVQAAVDAAESTDGVLLKGGTYALTAPVAVSGKHLTVKGAEPRTAVLDGQGACQVLNVQNDSAYEISIEGLVIKNGSAASGAGVYAEGYGAANVCGPIQFKDCFITNCAATGKGGGVYAEGGIVFTNCTVVGNQAASGGGVYTSSKNVSYYWGDPTSSRRGYPTFEGCSIIGNASTGDGGGLCHDRAVLLQGCRFAGNTSGGTGGSVQSGLGLWIRDSIIVCGGKASYSDGVFVNGANRFEGTTFTGNSAGFGAVFANGLNRPEFYGCVFTNNANAGIYVAKCLLRNCLFDSKPLVFSGAWQTENCTFAQGVKFRTDSGAGSLAATNCLFASNKPFDPVPGEKAVVDAANCCFETLPTEGDYCHLPGSFSVKPKFVDAAAGDYRLQDSSRCRDRGLILDWMTEDAVDADGNPRRIDKATGLFSVAALPDVGCFENQSKWLPLGLLLVVH